MFSEGTNAENAQSAANLTWKKKEHALIELEAAVFRKVPLKLDRRNKVCDTSEASRFMSEATKNHAN